MAKIVLDDTNSGYNLSKINANFQKIVDALQNDVLYRDNPTGEPNQLQSTLDANGQDVINIGSLKADNLTLDGLPITDSLNASITAAQEAATASGVSAGQSAASAVTSAGSATASAGSLATMQTIFLGVFASDPVAGPEGSLYYNSTTLELKYRRTGVWVSFPQANQVARQPFVNGTDYTAGTSTTLTLPATTYTKTILWVMFDGSYVQPNRYTLTSQTLLTFTAAITAGVSRIEVAYIAPLASAIIDDNSLTTVKFVDQSVTTAKIADTSVTAAKLGTVGPINLALGVPLAVATTAALATADITNYTYFQTSGYAAGLDGGGGRYVITSDTTTTVNGGTIIAHTATGRRFFLVQSHAPTLAQFGAKMDGTTDDAVAVQNMSQVAGLPINIPDGKNLTINTATTIATRITFGKGAKITANAVVNLVYKPVADFTANLFWGVGPFNPLGGSPAWDEAPADWFNYAGTLGTAISIAWRFSKVVSLNASAYNWTTSAVVPAQTQGLVLKGKGYRATQVIVANNLVAVNYSRVAGQAASSLEISHIDFEELNNSRTSFAIQWLGTATGTAGSETVLYDDNWLRVSDCVFIGLSRGTYTKYCTQCFFTRNYAQVCATMHYKERDSSFQYHTDEMCLDGQSLVGAYIYQDDPIGDGLSNALSVTDCRSVFSAGIDIRLKNYQLATFANCILDLGTAGIAALWLFSCQDVHYHNGWIACATAGMNAGRAGIYIEASRHNSFHNNTFNGCDVGVLGNGASTLNVEGNVFIADRTADITDIGVAVGWIVTGNRHKNGTTSLPVSIGGTSSKSNLVCNNIFSGTTYTIPTGTNSINTPNIFSAGFPI